MNDTLKPFIASIEPIRGNTFVYGYHLGTDEGVARQIVKEMFKQHAKRPHGCRTVALLRDRKIVDIWDGDEWQSVLINQWFDELEKVQGLL